MPFEMMRRKQAIAVRNQQVGAAARPHSVVAAERDAEALMFVRRQLHRKIDGPRKLVNHFMRAILRTVVDDDHLKAARHVVLDAQATPTTAPDGEAARRSSELPKAPAPSA